MKPTFSELIKSSKPTLVDFYADWCGPCKAMKPILEDLKNRIGEKATIIKIDVDKNPAIASAYGVQGIPTLIIFKDGHLKWKQAGVQDASTLQRLIEENV